MSTYSEMKEIPEKFTVYRDRLVELLKRNNIKSMKEIYTTYKSSNDFQSELNEILTDIIKADGGKLSLTTIGLVVGSALGGVGIAAMGGAIGLPLSLILGLGGFLAGTKIDDTKILSSEKKLSITLSDELIERLMVDADYIGCSVEDLIKKLIENTYNSY